MRTARSIQHGRPALPCAGTLRLDFDARQKSRLLGRLTNGEELAILLPRGTTLEGGDFLETDDGYAVLLEPAAEELSVANTGDPLLLARVAYHLGNRHVALEVKPGRLAYRHDHVLDDLVRRFGLSPTFEH
ncbi:MAG TPA: urease accessory protein UreE, partial [Polyangiaceae bacterium]